MFSQLVNSWWVESITSVTLNYLLQPTQSQCRDLGVVITSSDHIQQITAKAHQRANSILRCFVSGNTSLLVRVFLVYVRPVLKYNSVVWSPHRIQDITRIEKVQRHFAKRLRWVLVSLGCHFHVHFSNLWQAFASRGFPAIVELLVNITLAIAVGYP